MVGEPVSGMARCPYDPRHANVALFAGSISSLHTKAEKFRVSRRHHTQFSAPDTGMSVPLCLPLQMIYSPTCMLHCLFGFSLSDLVLSLHLYLLLLNLLLSPPQMEASLPVLWQTSWPSMQWSIVASATAPPSAQSNMTPNGSEVLLEADPPEPDIINRQSGRK